MGYAQAADERMSRNGAVLLSPEALAVVLFL